MDFNFEFESNELTTQDGFCRTFDIECTYFNGKLVINNINDTDSGELVDISAFPQNEREEIRKEAIQHALDNEEDDEFENDKESYYGVRREL